VPAETRASGALRLAFMGTPEFALPALDALLAAGHEIAAVYSQPPRPAGRGHKPQASAVQRAAEAKGLPVHTPVSLKTAEEEAAFRALRLDAAIVVAYGLLLPKPILEAPRLGCLNIHGSLLPRWRGAAPIQRAILAGDAETGITIMQMDAGLDTGGILLQRALPIGAEDSAADLHDRLARLGASLAVEALDGLAAGRLSARPQPAAGVAYAAKLDRAEARIDWREPAEAILRRLRAFTPWPGLWFEARGERIRLLAAAARKNGGAAPGTLLEDDAVACGDNTALMLKSVQRAGRSPMAMAELRRGFPIAPGTRLA